MKLLTIGLILLAIMWANRIDGQVFRGSDYESSTIERP